MIDTIQDLVDAEKSMPGRSINKRKPYRLISLKLPNAWIEEIERMVGRGEFMNRSDSIRHMVKYYFDAHGIEFEKDDEHK